MFIRGGRLCKEGAVSRIGQREKWSHDAAPQLLGQPSREPWSECCPSEPLPSHSAKSPGTHIPSPGGLKELAAANLTPSILPGVQAVTSTIPPIQATTRSCFSCSTKSPISASISALTCQYLKEGPHLFSLVTKIASRLSSLTPFCPLLPCY